MYKIALIHAVPYNYNYNSSLALSYLKTYIEKNLNLPVDIRICSSEEDIIEFFPQLLGISATTSVIMEAVAMAGRVKKQTKAMVVLGGYHITFLPEEIERDCFDIGVIGEGEKTFTELIEALALNKSYSEIKGIVYKKNGRAHINPPRPLLNVEEIPTPDKGRVIYIEGKSSVLSSRGCPYGCKYCSSTAFWKKVRYFSPETVVNEIKWNHEYLGADEIIFEDDLFIYPEERLHKIVDLLENEGLLSKIKFLGQVRSNLVTPTVMSALKRLNFNHIRFGAESGSDRILKMYKPGSSVEHNQKLIDMAVESGLNVSAFFMLGFIGEEKEDILQTISFIKKNEKHLDFIDSSVFLFQAFPGTEVWNNLDSKFKADIIENQRWNELGMLFPLDMDGWGKFLYFNDAIPRNEFIELIQLHLSKWIFKHNDWQTLRYKLNWTIENEQPSQETLAWYQKMIWYVEKVEEILNEGHGCLLYGAGQIGRDCVSNLPFWVKYWLSDTRLRFGGVVDKNYKSLPAYLDGDVPVLPVEAALKDSNEKILITAPDYFEEIQDALLGLGVAKSRIIPVPKKFPDVGGA